MLIYLLLMDQYFSSHRILSLQIHFCFHKIHQSQILPQITPLIIVYSYDFDRNGKLSLFEKNIITLRCFKAVRKTILVLYQKSENC